MGLQGDVCTALDLCYRRHDIHSSTAAGKYIKWGYLVLLYVVPFGSLELRSMLPGLSRALNGKVAEGMASARRALLR